MTSVHVLLLPSWYPTSDNPIRGSFFREQAHALAKRGMKVGVLFPWLHSLRRIQDREIWSLGLQVEDDDGILTYRYEGINCFPRFQRGQWWLYRQVGKRVFEKYATDNGIPDILHAHSALNGGVVAAHLKSRFQAPLVLTEHASSYARQTLTRQQREKAKAVFRACDRLIAVSPQLGKMLGKQFPQTLDRWEWIPNLVDDGFFGDDPLLEGKRRSCEFVFLNVAGMTEKKGQKDLLAAFTEAFRGETAVELWLGGDGPMRPGLQSTASAWGVRDQLRFLGRLNRDEVAKAMRAADTFVLSSRYETFGVVLVEALASGTPVIATRCGGPESIVTEDDGVLVPVGDLGALADAMKAMRRSVSSYDPRLLRDRCRRRFGADTVVTKLQSVYWELLNGVQRTVHGR